MKNIIRRKDIRKKKFHEMKLWSDFLSKARKSKFWLTFKKEPVHYIFIFCFFVLIIYLLYCRIILGRIEWVEWTGFTYKKLWHWLDLFGAPLLLAYIAWRFTVAQKKREMEVTSLEKENAIQMQKDKQRIDKEFFQTTLLNDSLDNMYLLIENKLSPLEKASGKESKLARSKIISALLVLVNPWKKTYVDFLQSTNSFVNFQRSELSGINMERCNISQVKFNGSKLTHINFANSKIHGTKFFMSTLTNVDFFSTEGVLPIFRKATLEKVDFNNATLIQADFQGATINTCSFHHATLDNVNFLGAQVDTNTTWEETIFINTTMADGTLRNS